MSNGTGSRKALDRVIGHQDKVRLMVIEVLREETGRELEAHAHFQDEAFDWAEHNAQFRRDYATTSLKELFTAARKFYGLSNLDAIKDRRIAHKQQRDRRLANAA